MITRATPPTQIPLAGPPGAPPEADPAGAAARADSRAEQEREDARAASRAHQEARAAEEQGASGKEGPARADHTGTMGLLLIAVVVVLYVGEAVFLPVAAAILLYFLFAPGVRYAASWGIPRALSATLVLGVIVSVIGLSIYGLAGPAGSWMKRLPHAVEKIGDKVQALRQPMEQVSAAAQQMADLSKSTPRPAHGGNHGGDATAATATPAAASGDTQKGDAQKSEAQKGDAQSAAQHAAAGDPPDANGAANAQLTPGAAQQAAHDPDQDQGGAAQDKAANAGDPADNPADPAPADANDHAQSSQHSRPWFGGHGHDNNSAAKSAAPASSAKSGAEPSAISVSQPSLLAPYLLSGTFGVIGFLGELFITLVTLFFLLSTGGTLLNRAVVLIPALRRNPDPGMVYTSAPQTDAAAVLRESERQVGMYLRTTLMINAGLATVISGLFWAVNMPNPVLWGVMAGVLNFLPYVGPVIGVVVVFLAGLITFDTVAQAVVAPLIYVGCAFCEGNLLTPWIMGMRLALSPLAIFLWMMFWGFMWGAAGAIIAVPMLVMVREFCQRIEGLNAVGRLIEP
jgi:predicted PurR-regulated permease PerM